MHRTGKLLVVSIVFILWYTAAAVLGSAAYCTAAGLLLMAAGAAGAVLFYLEKKWLLDFRALLSLFWLGGEGIAALQLSKLQSPWRISTWIAFAVFYLCVLWGMELGMRLFAGFDRAGHRMDVRTDARGDMTERIFRSIAAVAILSVGCFWIEVVIMGYIPLFSHDTHAYNYFHVTGIHYITFSCMLVHPLTLIYVLEGGVTDTKRVWLLVLANLAALSIPIFCISKFQFILTLLLPIMVFFLYYRVIPWKKVLIGAAGLFAVSLAVFLFMTARRNYEEGYLDSIFQMKNAAMPLPFQYVYMYIANNYDNFNCLAEALADGRASYLFGLKELFPVFALSGLKFVFPGLTAYPTFFTIEELNTLTILYDAYYDFGLIGTALFGGCLGLVCSFLEKLVRGTRNPVSYLFYGQIAMYVILSFFSTWFTNPTTWFWLVVTWILYVYIGGYLKNNRNALHFRR